MLDTAKESKISVPKLYFQKEKTPTTFKIKRIKLQIKCYGNPREGEVEWLVK